MTGFVADCLLPAEENVREAVRLSAYAFKVAWDPNPAGKAGWSGILSSMRLVPEIASLTNSAFVRDRNLNEVQETALRAIVGYRRNFHLLHEVVSGLVEHDKLNDNAGFYNAVRKWWPLHEDVITAFRELQKGIDLPIIKKADEKIYLSDPRFDLSVLEPIFEPPAPQ